MFLSKQDLITISSVEELTMPLTAPETSSPLDPLFECLTSCLGSPIPQTFFNDESEIKKVLQPFENYQQSLRSMISTERILAFGFQ